MKRSDRHVKKPEDLSHFLRDGNRGPSDKDSTPLPLVAGEALDYQADPDDLGHTAEDQ